MLRSAQCIVSFKDGPVTKYATRMMKMSRDACSPRLSRQSILVSDDLLATLGLKTWSVHDILNCLIPVMKKSGIQPVARTGVDSACGFPRSSACSSLGIFPIAFSTTACVYRNAVR
jgi:hypothetical protein